MPKNVTFQRAALEAEIESHNSAGRTALTYAATYNHLEAVKTLIDRYLKTNSLLFLESCKTGEKIVLVTTLILIDSGADLEAKDQNGWTPLFWAARFGYTEVVKLLVSKGASKDLKDNNGDTPLSIAREWDRSEVVKFLTDGQV